MAGRQQVTVLVLPGLDGTGDLIRDFCELLRKEWAVEVVAYPAGTPLGYDDLVTCATRFLPGQNTVLVAESFSGPIAIEIAASDSRVVGLVLASSFARHPLPSWLAPAACSVPLRLVPATVIDWLLLGSHRSRQITARLRRVIRDLDPRVVRTRINAALTVDKLDRLGEVRCPMLMLAGRDDRLVGSRSVEEVRSRQPSCFVTYLDGPHMLLETCAGDCVDGVSRFIRMIPLPPD